MLAAMMHRTCSLAWLIVFAVGCNPAPATTDGASTGGPADTGMAATDPGTSSAPSPTTSGTTGLPGTGGGSAETSGTGGAPGTTGGSTSSTGAGGTDGESTSGTGGTGGTGATSSTSSTSGGHVEGCPGGKPLFQLPELVVDEGLEWCPDGQIHRHTAVECVHPLDTKACADPKQCMEPCDAFGEGVCNKKYGEFCTCQYPCLGDADCPADAACLCHGGLPVDGGGYNHYVQSSECVRAGCRTDAECAPFLCALSPGICGYGTVDGLFCHTAEDECVGDQDCVDQQLGNLCQFTADQQRWTCTEMALCE